MYREDSPDNYVIEEYDAILIAGFARHFRGCKEVLSRIRDRAKGIPIICGGNHASFAPYEILQFADFAVIGSGEIPAQKLLDQIFNGVYPTPDNLPDNTAMMPDRQT